MKNINFQDLTSKKNIFVVSFLAICMIFMFLNMFEIFKFENIRTNKILILIFFIGLTLYSSRIFWYKNVVQWNRKGMAIRINSFMGKSISFDEIRKVIFTEKQIDIIEFSGKKHIINLENINVESIDKLKEILSLNLKNKIYI